MVDTSIPLTPAGRADRLPALATPNVPGLDPIRAAGGGSVAAAVLIRMFHGATQLGLSPEAFYRTTGLSPADLTDPELRVPMRPYLGIWQALIGVLPGPVLGLRMAATASLGDWALVGVLMMHSPTLGAALDKQSRFARLINSSLRIGVRIEGERAHYYHQHRLPEVVAVHPLVEFSFGSVVQGLRAMTGHEAVLHRIELQLPSSVDPAPYERHFGCPVSFGHAENVVVFDAAWLDRPLGTASPQVAGYLEQMAEQLLLTTPDTGHDLDDIRRGIEAAILAGSVTQADIAARLLVSQRTLQRRLEQAGTSYSELLQLVRQELAGRLLRQPRITTLEIALMLGYAELSSFHRAFKRWTGLTPDQYRQQPG